MSLIKYNNRSIKDLTTTPTAAGGGGTGALVHIKTLTASSSATLSFVHGTADVVLDSTYPIYKFEFINIHAATDDVYFTFQSSTNSGSAYGVAITSTAFRSEHYENGAAQGLNYHTALDLAQGTAFQGLDAGEGIGNDADQSLSGTLTLYNPSDTTFVKHFLARTQKYTASNISNDSFIAGYFNTTTAIDGVQFKMSSGNIDAGKIKLFGILDA